MVGRAAPFFAASFWMPRLTVNSYWRLGRFSSKLRWLAIAVLAVAGWLLAWGAACLLIVRAPIQRADAILILSGSSAIRERTQLAAQLFKEGRAPRIILTNDNEQAGWESKEQRNPFFYEWAVRLLQKEGVPAERIEVIPQPVSSTYEESELVRVYADQHQLHSLLLVTSAYHSRRTSWTFRHVFRGTETVVGLEHTGPVHSPWTWWLHRSGWRMVPGEYVKLAYYWLRF